MKISIRYKILISFSFVFFTAMAAVIYFSAEIVSSNNEVIIKNEMIETRKNLDIYLKQYFTMNNLEPTKSAFKVEALNIANDLSYKTGSKVALYSMEGENLSDQSFDNRKSKSKDSEIIKALNGKTYYTINKENDKVIAYLNYSVSLRNQDIGILRYSRDYSELYESGDHLIAMIKLTSIIIFFVILVVAFMISKHITRPITELTMISKEISKGDLDVNININTNDEIGQLGKSFLLMIQQIKSQITTIQDDRDKLKKLENHRKRFFDNVTHELKTPITTITGYAEIIKDNGFNDKEFFEKGINNIISEGERLHRMVVDLLEYSKGTSTDFKYEFQYIDLSQLLRNVCEGMRAKAQKYNILIRCTFEDGIEIIGDEDKLKQVFINIIDNSIKYGKVNSEIWIRAAYNRDHNNSDITVEIEDSGEGISSEELKNIFEPFYRVNKKSSREKGSNGLGLAIVKAIMNKHNADIFMHSTIGAGTKVTLVFKNLENFAEINNAKDSL
ncbi:MAG: HAMP domain-containing sensor histidine kinase [Bacillota bacterium]|nr:HAMP domain-containing sensor histidine kinase [Bacillota bacterium]